MTPKKKREKALEVPKEKRGSLGGEGLLIGEKGRKPRGVISGGKREEVPSSSRNPRASQRRNRKKRQPLADLRRGRGGGGRRVFSR